MKKKKTSVKIKPHALATLRGAPRAHALRKERWSSLNQHLDQALNHWNEISKKSEGELPADQKQLQEVKGLLQDLKGQLDQF
jgi:hypothetical protein